MSHSVTFLNEKSRIMLLFQTWAMHHLRPLLLVLALLAAASDLHASPNERLSSNQIIKAYCSLVQNQKFYRFHKLKENCMLNVQIYKKQASCVFYPKMKDIFEISM